MRVIANFGGLVRNLRSQNFALHSENMATNEYQRPEGRLLSDALKRSGRSARKVAGDIGISDTRLRHIINGYQPVGRGQVIEVVGPADTVARMAEALGVSAEEMTEAGRSDVAEAMNPLRTVGIMENGDLWLSSLDEEFSELAAWVALPEDQRGRPPIRALVLWEADELLEAAREKYQSELRLKDFVIRMLESRPAVSAGPESEVEARLRQIEEVMGVKLPREGDSEHPSELTPLEIEQAQRAAVDALRRRQARDQGPGAEDEPGHTADAS